MTPYALDVVKKNLFTPDIVNSFPVRAHILFFIHVFFCVCMNGDARGMKAFKDIIMKSLKDLGMIIDADALICF